MCHGALDSADLVQIVRSLLSPKVTAHLPDHWQSDAYLGDTGSWIHERDREGAMLLVVLAPVNTPVGVLTLFESTGSAANGAEIRIGYVLSEPAWGQGLATELVAGLIDWSRKAGMRKLVGGVAPGNAASVRVLEKCGFLPADPGVDPGHAVRLYELAIRDH